MKNSTLLSLLVSFFLISCSSEKKEDKKNELVVKKEKVSYSHNVSKASTDINFTAYKTTEKVPVGGKFKKIDVVSGGNGNSVKDAINNTEFSIPISSLETNDSSRNYKIRKFFFGVMANTKLLSGKLSIKDETSGIASITMNGETKDVPFAYTIKDNNFNMVATIDVNAWNASAALASLNKVCEELHKGADGVSKTWSEVALNITTKF